MDLLTSGDFLAFGSTDCETPAVAYSVNFQWAQTFSRCPFSAHRSTTCDHFCASYNSAKTQPPWQPSSPRSVGVQGPFLAVYDNNPAVIDIPELVENAYRCELFSFSNPFELG